MGLMRNGRTYLRKLKQTVGEFYANLLAHGGVVAAKIVCEPEQRKGKNDPLRGIEIVPLRSIAKVARIGVMKVVISLAKTDEGNQPAIATAIFLA